MKEREGGGEKRRGEGRIASVPGSTIKPHHLYFGLFLVVRRTWAEGSGLRSSLDEM